MDKKSLPPRYQHESYYFEDVKPLSNRDTVKNLWHETVEEEVVGKLWVGQVIFSPVKSEIEKRKQKMFLAYLLDRLMDPVFEQNLVVLTRGGVIGEPILPEPKPKAGEYFKVSDEPGSSRCPVHTIFQNEKKFVRFVYKNNTKPVFEEQVKGAVRDLEYTLPGIKKLFSSPPGPTPMR